MMNTEMIMDRIEGDMIIIHDTSGEEFKVLKKIIFISENGKKEYRIQKSKNRKYSMQK